MEINKMIRLAGLQEAKRVIEDAIKALEDSGVEPVALSAPRKHKGKGTPVPGRKKRTLSPEARKAIADAQKRRWGKASEAVDAAHAAGANAATWQPPAIADALPTPEDVEASTR